MSTARKDEQKVYRVRAGGGFSQGGPRRFAVEIYAPAPGRFSWQQVEVLSSYSAATERAQQLREAK